MARIRTIIALGCALSLLWTGAGPVRAAQDSDSLSSLYADILKDPKDTKANLRYARAAEVQGKLRLALSAYERVIVNDPGNREAQAGFARIRRKLEPATTSFRLQVGAGYDSNPLNLHLNSQGKAIFQAHFSMRDERQLLGRRWRTLADLIGEYTLDIGELLYSYVGVQSGPLFDVGPRLTIHPAVGGAVATLDKRLFYSEGSASVTFEGRFGGAFHALRLRGGYRSYGGGFTANEGPYADAFGRFTIPAAFGGRGAILIAPWARWSGISGAVRNELNDEITPGRYVEWGLEIGYYLKPLPDLTVGASVQGRQRLFFQTKVAGERREDNYVSPGISITRSNILSCSCDLLLDYRYRINNSNDPESDYRGHRVTLSFASRF